MPHLLDLPDETLLQIVTHLPENDRLNVEKSCKKLHQICLDRSFHWHTVHQPYKYKTYDDFLLEEYVEKNLNKIYKLDCSLFTELTNYSLTTVNRIPNLEELTLGKGMSALPYLKIPLQKLDIRHLPSSCVGILPNDDFPYLYQTKELICYREQIKSLYLNTNVIGVEKLTIALLRCNNLGIGIAFGGETIEIKDDIKILQLENICLNHQALIDLKKHVNLEKIIIVNCKLIAINGKKDSKHLFSTDTFPELEPIEVEIRRTYDPNSAVQIAYR